MKTATDKTMIFNNARLAGEVTSFYHAIADILNDVKKEFESLGIGEFTRPLMLGFLNTGPTAIIENYDQAFKEFSKDWPEVMKVAFLPGPKETLNGIFQPLYDKIQQNVNTIRNIGNTEPLLDRFILIKQAGRFDLFEIADGKIIFSPESDQLISQEFVFYAKTERQIKLLGLCQKTEKLIAEISDLVRPDYQDYIWSLPSDRFTAFFNFDQDMNVKFDASILRFIEK